ncbi:PRC-barrel domain-containing protein [Paralcaligenes ureilyticus]|uniref:PRC-barrel domain protein n=1 Tax=Paralcaligenes ureilyticus TaxID=627131 RepID=A0A4R3MDL8_9BURK|nr:PRC-barrel domain-containing protein [Paralcaligenes ureilyticus]TCT10177.1 PRC-barrel domain protein [Paralcaligenes ureilyticus]
MLRTVASLNGDAIRAIDDELGRVKEIYFDDERWGVRYLIVETGSWLSKQPVLLSPYSIKAIDDASETIQVSLTRQQIKNAPDVDTKKPVSRQSESEYSRYYGYEQYWTGPYMWGIGAYPMPMSPVAEGLSPAAERREESSVLASEDRPGDIHLHSSDEVCGYDIRGTDEDIGHVKDFIFDDKEWAIRYLVVDTHNWWPGGKKVLVATQWIENIDWTDSTVQTKLTREQIQNSPEYNEDMALDRDYEAELHHFYGRKGYWDE